MIITISSYKGGVGKSTSALHLAAYFYEKRGSVLCIDGDPNRSLIGWSRRGSIPFPVIDERSAPKHVAKYQDIVIDTAARPDRDDLKALIDGCDLLILPCTPDALSIEALALTTEALKQLGSSAYKVLLTIVPPKPNRDGAGARKLIEKSGVPILKNDIRRRVAFQRAALQGCLVYEVKDRGVEAWQDYVKVGKEIDP